MRPGIDQAIARGLSYAPICRHALVRNVHARPRRSEEVRRAHACRFSRQAAGLQLLALIQLESEARSARRSRNSSANSARWAYKFQFVTLAGFHALNYSMFKLAHGYRDRGMAAYSELQEAEFAAEADGYIGDQTPARSRHRILRRCRTCHRGRGKFDRGSATARPKKNSFIEGDALAPGVRGADRQPAGSTLRGRSAERVPRLRGALRRDHPACARTLSGARLARQPDDAVERLHLYSQVLADLTSRVKEPDGRASA